MFFWFVLQTVHFFLPSTYFVAAVYVRLARFLIKNVNDPFIRDCQAPHKEY
jgi:hypothetical protein